MDEALREQYREILMEHSRTPQGKGQPERWDRHESYADHETGDKVQLWIQLDEDGKIARLNWDAQGSGVLQASCSLMSGHLRGRSRTDACRAIDDFVSMLTGAASDPDWNALGDAAALSGIRHLPARVRCASLPWRTARQVLVRA